MLMQASSRPPFAPIFMALFASVAHVSCRPASRMARVDVGESDARGGPASAASATEPETPDACASALPVETQVRVAASVVTPGLGPFDVLLTGAGASQPLFSIDGSGEGEDEVKCSSTESDASQLRIDCRDGPQSKSASVSLSDEHLETDVVVDGVQSHRSTAIKPCARLIGGLPERMERASVASSPRCPVTDHGTPTDAFLRHGSVDSTKRMFSIFLDVPRLGIHHLVEQVIEHPLRWESQVTRRGWVFLTWNLDEAAFSAKVVAIPGEIVIDRASQYPHPGGYSREQERIPIPCNMRVVLHALACTAPQCKRPTW